MRFLQLPVTCGTDRAALALWGLNPKGTKGSWNVLKAFPPSTVQWGSVEGGNLLWCLTWEMY